MEGLNIDETPDTANDDGLERELMALMQEDDPSPAPQRKKGQIFKAYC